MNIMGKKQVVSAFWLSVLFQDDHLLSEASAY